MTLCRFAADGSAKSGLIEGDKVLDLTAADSGQSMRRFLATNRQDALDPGDARRYASDLTDVTLLAPIHDPEKSCWSPRPRATPARSTATSHCRTAQTGSRSCARRSS